MKNIFYLFTILILTSLFSHTVVDFNVSMNNNSKEYKKKYSSPSRKKNLQRLKNLYEKNSFDILESQNPTIPLIIHQIWVGPNQRPELLQQCMNTWKQFHPEWHYILWTDAEVEDLVLYNQDLYNAATDPREKADILRYEILYRFGGVYVDCDFECIQSFDDLHHRYNLYVGISPNNVEEIITNALIGCASGHPLMLKVIENQKTAPNQKWFFRSGVYYFSNQCIKYLADAPETNIALPTSFFYPLPYLFNKNLSLDKYIKPETRALHYWAHSQGTNWKPKKGK